MSWLSKLSGVHISPHGIKIEPMKALGTALTIGSFGGLGPVGAALGHIPGAAAIASGAGKVKGALSMIPGAGKIGEVVANHGGIGGIAHSALDFAKGHAPEILAGLQVANAAKLGKKSNQYADNAMNSVNQSYMDRAGLRTAGIEGMLHPQVPDVTQLARIRSNNPYAGPQPSGIPLARAA